MENGIGLLRRGTSGRIKHIFTPKKDGYCSIGGWVPSIRYLSRKKKMLGNFWMITQINPSQLKRVHKSPS